MGVLKMVDPHNHGFHYYDGIYNYLDDLWSVTISRNSYRISSYQALMIGYAVLIIWRFPKSNSWMVSWKIP